MSGRTVVPADVATRAAQAILRSQRYAYAVIRPNLTVAVVSAELTAFTNTPDCIVGRRLIDVFDELATAEEDLRALLAGRSDRLRLPHINRTTAGGTTAYFTLHIEPLDPAAPGDGLLLLLEETSAESRLQQKLVQERNELRLVRAELDAANRALVHSDRLKSIFMAMVAHDMRTPLTAVKGYTALLELALKKPGETVAGYLSAIMGQSVHLEQLIADLVQLDQAEQGLLKLNRHACDLAPVVADVVAVQRHTADLKQLALTLTVTGAPLTVWGDVQRLRQIAYNIIGNAVKYTPTGGAVAVELGRDGGDVVMTVRDDGPGMPPDQLARLFQLYYRTDGSVHGGTSGTGLGLYIVHQLVTAHGGTVKAASAPGAGATFTVRLPAGDSAEEAPHGR